MNNRRQPDSPVYLTVEGESQDFKRLKRQPSPSMTLGVFFIQQFTFIAKGNSIITFRCPGYFDILGETTSNYHLQEFEPRIYRKLLVVYHSYNWQEFLFLKKTFLALYCEGEHFLTSLYSKYSRFAFVLWSSKKKYLFNYFQKMFFVLKLKTAFIKSKKIQSVRKIPPKMQILKLENKQRANFKKERQK
jgi:hypothetical protein